MGVFNSTEEDQFIKCNPPNTHAADSLKCEQTNCSTMICKKCEGQNGLTCKGICVLCAFNQ